MWYNKVNVISTVEFGLRGTNLVLNNMLVWIRTVKNGLAEANNKVFSRNQVDLFILYVLGGNATFNKSELYGMNMWDTLSLDLPSPREEIIHNYDRTTGAIRQGEYKVIVSVINNTMSISPVELSCCELDDFLWFQFFNY